MKTVSCARWAWAGSCAVSSSAASIDRTRREWTGNVRKLPPASCPSPLLRDQSLDKLASAQLECGAPIAYRFEVRTLERTTFGLARLGSGQKEFARATLRWPVALGDACRSLRDAGRHLERTPVVVGRGLREKLC